MDIVLTVVLAAGAFLLGSVPFSVIVGRVFLRKDIQDYGDGNPGAFNVFRAGGQKTGVLAVVLDVAKGIPFVWLAHSQFGLPHLSLVVIGMGAVLGHAFSPFLHWHGGKAVAVSFGVLLALPQHEAILAFVTAFFLCFLVIAPDAWIVILGASTALGYLILTRQPAWLIILLCGILVVFIYRHFEDLHTLPRLRGRFIRWLQSRLRGSTPV
ncbi:MAG: glycerol-3-phosphate acyltransferase [Dehalococcoidales bacterium]|nr:glycerol-3-phosphate acyltransferase [Dehalococcoidales bacterium]